MVLFGFFYSTAARNNLSTEELITALGSTVNTLPKHAIQVIRHVWNEQGKSVGVSEDKGNMSTVGQVTRWYNGSKLMIFQNWQCFTVPVVLPSTKQYVDCPEVCCLCVARSLTRQRSIYNKGHWNPFSHFCLDDK